MRFLRPQRKMRFFLQFNHNKRNLPFRSNPLQRHEQQPILLRLPLLLLLQSALKTITTKIIIIIMLRQQQRDRLRKSLLRIFPNALLLILLIQVQLESKIVALTTITMEMMTTTTTKDPKAQTRARTDPSLRLEMLELEETSS